MNRGWIAYMLLTGSFVAIAVLALDAACKLARWPRRWAPFAGMLLIMALALFAPERRNTVLPDNRGIVFASAATKSDAESAVPAATPASGSSALSGAMRQISSGVDVLPRVVERALPRQLENFYPMLWGAASTVLLLLFLLVHARFLRARRHWPLVDLHGIRVRLSPAAGPAVVGAFRPDIVIPRWLLQRDESQQRLVLAHEGEHVRTRDPLVLASAWTCALAMPWHPAVWWMLWRMRLAVELDCDARVLARGAPRRSYGALLIELSQQSAGLPVGATALSDRTTHLERRLLAMNSHRPSFPMLRGSALVFMAAAMVLSACALRKPAGAGAALVPDEVTLVAAPAQVRMHSDPVIIVDGVVMVRDAVEPLAVAVPTPVTVSHSDPLIIVDGVIQKRMTTPAPPPGAPPVAGAATTAVATPQTVPVPVQQRLPASAIDSVVLRELPGGLLAQQQQGRPMIVVNGRVVRDERNDLIGSLKLENIQSIEYLQGAAAMQQYGDAARNGVISIRTARTDTLATVQTIRPNSMAYVDSGVVRLVDTLISRAARGSDMTIQLRNPRTASGPGMMVIIDGVIQMRNAAGNLLDSSGNLLTIEASRIKSVEIVRGAAAVQLYGARAENGVINIKTKK